VENGWTAFLKVHLVIDSNVSPVCFNRYSILLIGPNLGLF